MNFHIYPKDAPVSAVISGTDVETDVGLTVELMITLLEFTPVLRHLYTLNSSVITYPLPSKKFETPVTLVVFEAE
jgi:hypothetical protein